MALQEGVCLQEHDVTAEGAGPYLQMHCAVGPVAWWLLWYVYPLPELCKLLFPCAAKFR